MSETTSIGLRERKAAKTRIDLVNAATKQMETRSFQEINVEELCEEVMISKVTFFSYFPTKDHLLWFISSVWIYRLVVDCRLSGKDGMAAIKHLFDLMTELFNKYTHMYSSFATMNPNQFGNQKHELTVGDRLELYPDGSSLQLEVSLSMGQFLHSNIKLAIDRQEVKTTLDDKELAILVGSIYHGSGLVGLRVDPDRPGDTFQTTFHSLMKLINR